MKTANTTLMIFDCDGVLVDSEPLANRTFIHCLRQDGFDVDEAYGYQHFLGISTRDCIAHVETKFNRKVSEGFLNTLSLLTNDEIKNGLLPIPHIKEALDVLQFPRCVASGSEPDKIELSLQVTGLRSYFDSIFSSLQVPRGKPHPDVFLLAAKEMGFTPEQCIVVEDSNPGFQAGLNAGMRVLLYRPHELGSTKFPSRVTVFKDMKQLPELVQQTVEAQWA